MPGARQAEPAPSLRCCRAASRIAAPSPLAHQRPPASAPLRPRRFHRHRRDGAVPSVSAISQRDRSAGQLDRQAVCAAQSDQVAMVAAAAASSSSSSSSVAIAPPSVRADSTAVISGAGHEPDCFGGSPVHNRSVSPVPPGAICIQASCCAERAAARAQLKTRVSVLVCTTVARRVVYAVR